MHSLDLPLPRSPRHAFALATSWGLALLTVLALAATRAHADPGTGTTYYGGTMPDAKIEQGDRARLLSTCPYPEGCSPMPPSPDDTVHIVASQRVEQAESACSPGPIDDAMRRLAGQAAVAWFERETGTTDVVTLEFRNEYIPSIGNAGWVAFEWVVRPSSSPRGPYDSVDPIGPRYVPGVANYVMSANAENLGCNPDLAGITSFDVQVVDGSAVYPQNR